MTWPTELLLTPPVVLVGVLAAGAVLALPSRSPRREAGPADGAGRDAIRPGDADARDLTTADGDPDPGRQGGRVRRVVLRLRRSSGGAGPAPSAEEVASAMALLALAYRTGLPTWQVLTAVARTTADPVARDLRQVATALQWGAGEAEAWAAVGTPWRPAARVVSLSHAGGVAPGPLLTTASDDLSRTEIDRLEIAVAQVGVRLVAPLGLVLLPAFCLTTVVPLVVALGRQLLIG